MAIEYEEELRTLTAVDPLQLNREFETFAGKLATAGARLSLAVEAFLEADLAFDRTEAQLFIEHRVRLAEAAEADKKVKVTEASVREQVVTDQRYVDARMSRIDAEVERSKARVLVDALLAKKDMLVSLGASVRAEMGGDPSVRALHRHAHGRDE